MSQCGTGKTRVYLTELKLLADDREQLVASEDTRKILLDDGERLYKPILILLPAAVLDQCFNEITKDWGAEFNVYSFYQSKGSVKNRARDQKTLSCLDDLQDLVNSLRRKSDNPAVSHPETHL